MHQIVFKALVWKWLVFFFILRSHDGFEKFQTITFSSQFKSSHAQMFFRIGVLKNFATLKHLCRSFFSIKSKKRLRHRSFPVNIAKCLRTAFFIEQLRWLFLSAWKSNCSVLGIYQLFLLTNRIVGSFFMVGDWVKMSATIVSRRRKIPKKSTG